jgi:hypothetical protein
MDEWAVAILRRHAAATRRRRARRARRVRPRQKRELPPVAALTSRCALEETQRLLADSCLRDDGRTHAARLRGRSRRHRRTHRPSSFGAAAPAGDRRRPPKSRRLLPRYNPEFAQPCDRLAMLGNFVDGPWRYEKCPRSCGRRWRQQEPSRQGLRMTARRLQRLRAIRSAT